MSTARAIKSFLSSVSEITDLVEDRIFPGVAPVGTEMPFVNIQRITNRQEAAHDGDQALGEALYQFDVYSNRFDEVDVVRRALLGLNGQRVEVDGSGELLFIHSNDAEGYDPLTREHSARVEFTVWH